MEEEQAKDFLLEQLAVPDHQIQEAVAVAVTPMAALVVQAS